MTVRNRRLNEKPGMCRTQGCNAAKSLSFCHLTQQRLINGLADGVNERHCWYDKSSPDYRPKFRVFTDKAYTLAKTMECAVAVHGVMLTLAGAFVMTCVQEYQLFLSSSTAGQVIRKDLILVACGSLTLPRRTRTGFVGSRPGGCLGKTEGLA